MSYPIHALSQLPADSSYLSHEKVVRKFWEDNNVSKFVADSQDKKNEKFILMDGPPFANVGSSSEEGKKSSGLHYGHLFLWNLKDAVLRYHTMHGKICPRQSSMDCHGLPIEQVIMKQLQLNTTVEIEKFGVKQFCDACRKMIYDCEESWGPVYDLVGRWIDFGNSYKTLDTNFMESVWWIYKEITKKGLTYKGYKVMPFSTGCETCLSNFEAGLNYKEKITNSVYVCFTITSENLKNYKLVAWTTTPWTLLSNIALCVGPEMRYVVCEDDNQNKYIVAESSVNNLKLNITSVTYLALGKELVGLEYEPLFNFFDFHYHKVLADPYVKDSGEIGTGIVHNSASHGEDDCRVCLENNVLTSKDLDKVCLVNYQGKYIDKVGDYSGMYVFDADKKISKFLKEQGKIVRIQEYRHQYPYCYRSDTPLLYMAVSSFFVEVSKIKDDLVAMNEKITWTNKEIGEKRFKNWLENAKDWCISRNRYFGTPIPVWESEDGSESLTIGSIDELVTLAELNYRPTDIHLDAIKDIIIVSKTTGNVLKCCNFVFDCWLESGSAILASVHYPFENANTFDDKEYLSDFVAEGLDQTRGWFYTLLVISTIIMNKPPFKTVICSGIILDVNGQKMSKKYGNFVDPNILISKYGSDTLRLMTLKSPLVNGEPLLFKESDVKDTLQQMTPYVNVVKFFFEHYINSQTKENPIEIKYLCSSDDYNNSEYTLMDLWILEKVYLLRESIEKNMEEYKVDFVIKSIIDFVDDLANWYVKFNRDRLKGLRGEHDYESSLSVLFTVLFDYCIICAPFTPFLSEHLYQYLTALIPDDKNCTVHLELYPDIVRNHNMAEPFTKLQMLSRLIRSLRDQTKTHTSVKTPIKKCTLYHANQEYLNQLKALVSLIEDEVNCENYEFVLIEDDNSNLVSYTVKPNFKLIGQEYKKMAKLITGNLSKLTQEHLKSLHNGTSQSVEIVDGDILISVNKLYFDIVVTINMSDVTPNIKSLAENGLVVCADMTYDQETHEFSQVKNLMSLVQNCRKEMKLNPWNKIKVYYYNVTLTAEFDIMIEKYQNMIVAKLGTNFVATTDIPDSYKVFKFREFGTNSDKEIIIFVEVDETK